MGFFRAYVSKVFGKKGNLEESIWIVGRLGICCMNSYSSLYIVFVGKIISWLLFKTCIGRGC